MDRSAREFLQSLVEAHGISGYEEPVQAVYRRRVSAFAAEVVTDVMGSVTAVLNPEGRPRVLLDGHADEIGFVVQHIHETGVLYLDQVGGWDPEVVVGQRALVHTASGPLPGVFGKKAAHLMDEEEARKKSELHKLWVDVGAQDADEARSLVRLGDPVTLDAPFREVCNGRAVAKAFDNRAGLFVVAEALRLLAGRRFPAAVYGVSAVQEEIGLRGARTATYRIDPQVGIAVDVTHAVDYPEVDKRRAGEVALGKGPVLYRGANIHPRVFARLVEVAEREGIPYQIRAAGRGTGTDANVIQLSRSGVAAGLVAIPLRYMHTPCEMLALSDLEAGVRLLAAFTESVRPEESWT